MLLFQCPDLPIAIVEEILQNLPAEKVVCVCRLVCREWKLVVDSTAFWRKRCRREGFEPRNSNKIPSDWKIFYFLCKNHRNLIKNPDAERKFNIYWVQNNNTFTLTFYITKRLTPVIYKT